MPSTFSMVMPWSSTDEIGLLAGSSRRRKGPGSGDVGIARERHPVTQVKRAVDSRVNREAGAFLKDDLVGEGNDHKEGQKGENTEDFTDEAADAEDLD